MFLLDDSHKRLDDFVLYAGNSPRIGSECASHNGRVPAGGSVEAQCEAIARYIKFSRFGGLQSDVAGLCEVVVIGHRHISKYIT